MPTYVFKFGEMFPPDDPLSEWAATVALAFNDLSLVHDRLGDDEAVPHRWLYWLRLGIAHFAEAADFVRETETIPAVAEFIDSLPAKAQEHHCEFVRSSRSTRRSSRESETRRGFTIPA